MCVCVCVCVGGWVCCSGGGNDCVLYEEKIRKGEKKERKMEDKIDPPSFPTSGELDGMN